MKDKIWVLALMNFTNAHFGNATAGQNYPVDQEVADEMEEQGFVRILTAAEAKDAQAVFDQAGNGLAAAPQDAQITPTSAKGGSKSASSRPARAAAKPKSKPQTAKAKTGAS